MRLLKLRALLILATLLAPHLFFMSLMEPVSATTPSCVPSAPTVQQYWKPCPSVSVSVSVSASVSSSPSPSKTYSKSPSQSPSSSSSPSASSSATSTPVPLLPVTGASVPVIVVIGVGLVAIGAIIVFALRRRMEDLEEGVLNE